MQSDAIETKPALYIPPAGILQNLGGGNCVNITIDMYERRERHQYISVPTRTDFCKDFFKNTDFWTFVRIFF